VWLIWASNGAENGRRLRSGQIWTSLAVDKSVGQFGWSWSQVEKERVDTGQTGSTNEKEHALCVC